MFNVSDVSYRLDHVGLVVPDLVEAVTFYTQTFGMSVVSRESDTNVDPDAIGLPGRVVRLRGALLQAGPDVRLELHQYLVPTGTGNRAVSDTGFGHICFAVKDIQAAFDALSRRGLQFNTPPQLIEQGGLAGRWWVYGRDPWGNVIELGQDPTSRDRE